MTPQEFKNLRKNLGLSQRKMGEALGIKNYRTIQRYEAGELPIQGSVLMVLRYIKQFGLLQDTRNCDAIRLKKY